MKKGDIYMADMGEDEGNLQSGFRPVIIVSNDMANEHSPVVTVVPMTTKKKKKLPTHVPIKHCGLPRPSLVLAEQITSINKSQITEKMGSIKQTIYEKQVTTAIKIQLNML